MEKKNIIITGATGMIGGIALRQCLDSSSVGRVTAIGRKRTGLQHSKLHEVIIEDFMEWS